MTVSEKNVSATIDLLISYKKGEINLKNTVILFSQLTDISPHVAAEYISALSRSNVVELATTQRVKSKRPNSWV